MTTAAPVNEAVSAAPFASLSRLTAFATLIAIIFAAALLVGGSSGLAWLVVAHALVVVGASALSRKVTCGVFSRIVFLCFLFSSFVANCVTLLLDLSRGPLVTSYRGPSSASAAVQSSTVCLLFVITVCVGWFLVGGKQSMSVDPATSINEPSFMLAFLGFTGLLLRFPTVGSLVTFINADYTSVSERASGLVGLVSSVLRPLLAVGLFCLFVDGCKHGDSKKKVAAILLSPFAILAVSSFALNRAALILPAAAMMISFHLGVRRLTARVWITAAVTFAIAFFAVGSFRTDLFNSRGGQYSIDDRHTVTEDVVSAIQLYGQSPFLTGVLFETGGGQGFSPNSMAASVLSPIPAIGETFRDATGTARYNELIYGNSRVRDQIIPVWAETQRSLGTVGVVFLGLGVGFLLKRWGSRVGSRRSALDLYFLSLGGLWLSQIPITSLQVLSQVAIYILAPLAIVRFLRAR